MGPPLNCRLGCPRDTIWAPPITCTHHRRFVSPSSSWASPAPAETQVSQKPRSQPLGQPYVTAQQGESHVLTLYVYFSGWRDKLLNFLPLNYILSTTKESSFGSWTPNRLDQHWPLVISSTRGSEALVARLWKCSLFAFFQWNVLIKNKINKKIQKEQPFLRQTYDFFFLPKKQKKKAAPNLFNTETSNMEHIYWKKTLYQKLIGNFISCLTTLFSLISE